MIALAASRLRECPHRMKATQKRGYQAFGSLFPGQPLLD